MTPYVSNAGKTQSVRQAILSLIDGIKTQKKGEPKETERRDAFARSPGDLASKGDLRNPRMPRRFSYYMLQATALSLMARIFLNNCVTCCSSKSWSGPVGATSVNGGS